MAYAAEEEEEEEEKQCLERPSVDEITLLYEKSLKIFQAAIN